MPRSDRPQRPRARTVGVGQRPCRCPCWATPPRPPPAAFAALPAPLHGATPAAQPTRPHRLEATARTATATKRVERRDRGKRRVPQSARAAAASPTGRGRRGGWARRHAPSAGGRARPRRAHSPAALPVPPPRHQSPFSPPLASRAPELRQPKPQPTTGTKARRYHIAAAWVPLLPPPPTIQKKKRTHTKSARPAPLPGVAAAPPHQRHRQQKPGLPLGPLPWRRPLLHHPLPADAQGTTKRQVPRPPQPQPRRQPQIKRRPPRRRRTDGLPLPSMIVGPLPLMAAGPIPRIATGPHHASPLTSRLPASSPLPPPPPSSPALPLPPPTTAAGSCPASIHHPGPPPVVAGVDAGGGDGALGGSMRDAVDAVAAGGCGEADGWSATGGGRRMARCGVAATSVPRERRGSPPLTTRPAPLRGVLA